MLDCQPEPAPGDAFADVHLLDCGDLIRRGIFRSRSTIYRHVDAGIFPKPMKLPGGRVAWRAVDVRAWINKAAGEATA